MYMKRFLPLFAIVLTVFMLIGCGAKEVVDNTATPVAQETPVADAPAVVEAPAVEEAEVVEEVAEVAEDLPEEVLQPAETHIWIKYMIQPNDYLTKIAKKEYGVVSMWREMYDWNREMIGENPDLIYPFEELSLKKESASAKPKVYEYVDYTVEKGETLWCISKKLYGNSYAWIVILRDNLDILGSDYNSITPGMVLKIRTQL